MAMAWYTLAVDLNERKLLLRMIRDNGKKFIMNMSLETVLLIIMSLANTLPS